MAGLFCHWLDWYPLLLDSVIYLNAMKKLPIGIQNIREILTEGQLYVDKTQFALNLIQNGKHYFLSRPRRFGKSLFLSTLEEIFKGNKDLFTGCYIAERNYDWAPHLVLHLNLAEVLNETTQDFKASLQRDIAGLATKHNLDVDIPSAQEGLRNLVETLSKERQVVVLIDEYDKPIIDNLHRLDVAEGNRELLQSFFSTLKSLDKYIKFTFITGISRFSKVSLFSGANHLQDISMDARYAAMTGYTQEEVEQCFDAHIRDMAQAQSRTAENILEEIKAWYNGYRFSRAETHVYNPFSTLNYLSQRETRSYWYASGTPVFLLKELSKHPQSLVPLQGARAEENELTSSGSLHEIDLKALMFQTGYLTIQGYSTASRHYQLGFPNQEVREAFTQSLVKYFAKLNDALGAEMEDLLEAHDLTSFFSRIQQLLSKFPYQLFVKAQERTYHGFLLSLLSGMGLEVAAETPSSLGRVDVLLWVERTIYVMEIKLDQDPQAGIEQIKEQQYDKAHLGQGKSVALVGLTFSSKTRNLQRWAAELMDENGDLIKQLTPP